MKLKTSAIALAVAGSVAAPAVVQADGVYASARVGLWNTDTGGVSELDVRSFSSRFGAKGETDLGNGMIGFGKYEWDVDFNNDNGEDDIGVRQRHVGVKGGFGKITVGQAYHTFYNFVVGPTDIPWWHSGYSMIAYSGRTDNAITYAGGGKMFKFGATAYFGTDFEAADGTNPESGDEGLDGIEAGVSFGLGGMTLGIAIKDIEAVDNAVTGVVLSGISLGPANIGIGFQANDDDTSILVDATFGNAYVHYESLDLDAAGTTPTNITLGYTHKLGPKTTMYFEFFTKDADTSNSDDDLNRVMGVLKYDII